MTTPEKMYKEISTLTADLISAGLCVDQNFPSTRVDSNGDVLVGIPGADNMSVTLKNIPYHDAYVELKERRSYNIQLIDGALIQILYRFRLKEIHSHRLAFFPAPDLLEYQNNYELYEDDELYADVIMKNVVTTPIRFDFDREAFVDVKHPMSHLSVGQYKHCRIPVVGALSPSVFIEFILSAFYNTPFQRFARDVRGFPYEFPTTITHNEAGQLHLNIVVSH